MGEAVSKGSGERGEVDEEEDEGGNGVSELASHSKLTIEFYPTWLC